MKVRATQDGHYGGYYRLGPFENPDGTMAEGEVFEIDAKPYEMKDPETGRPLQEMAQTGELDTQGRPIFKPLWILDHKGNPKKDSHGNLIPKIRMATMFSPEWMEPVNDDATITYLNEREPLGVLPQMMSANRKSPANIAARPVNLPADILAVLGKSQEPGVSKVEAVAESPI
jgi:hypothetical protein